MSSSQALHSRPQDSPLADMPHGSPSSVHKRTRACLACGSGFEVNPCHAKEHRFCSARCRASHYRHPEQARLDFTPVRPAPATGEPYESARLWLLARLQQGPVCTLELRREPWPASLNPAQRVLELRNRQYRIKTERREGKTYYRLEQEG